jgi:cytochrome P450
MRTNPAIPTIRGLPLVGSLFDFRDRRLELQRRLSRECGDIGMYHMGPVPVVALSAPELIQSALVENADAFVKSRGLGKFGRPIFGEGLLTSEGAFHKRQRKLLAPAFSHRRIASYAQTMAEYAEQGQWEWHDGEALDAAEEMMKITLAIVGRTLFDADVSGEAHAVGEALTDAMEYMVDSVSSLVTFPYRWPTPHNRKMHRAVARLDELVYRIIRERRAEGVDKGDVLSMLLLARDEEDGQGMDDRQVRDEAMTLILAGHETTANALAWAWHLLTLHPSIYDRVQGELDGALAGRTPRMEDLPNLPYTLQVVKESMRLFPPAYVMGRKAIRDVEIGPYLFKRGSIVLINIFGMHHSPTYFRDPERFDPDRFELAAEKALPKGAYMPFGGGPRVCIGNHFALMEAQLILATIAQRTRFELIGEPDIEAEPLVTLRPKGGVHVRVRRRTSPAAACIAV